MQLLINGLSFPLLQMGPDFVFLQQACNHPPANATIILQVDQSERRWNVRLPEGISAESQRVAIAPEL